MYWPFLIVHSYTGDTKGTDSSPSMSLICCLTWASTGTKMTDLHNPCQKPNQNKTVWHIQSCDHDSALVIMHISFSPLSVCPSRSLYIRGIPACGRCTHSLLYYFISFLVCLENQDLVSVCNVWVFAHVLFTGNITRLVWLTAEAI